MSLLAGIHMYQSEGRRMNIHNQSTFKSVLDFGLRPRIIHGLHQTHGFKHDEDGVDGFAKLRLVAWLWKPFSAEQAMIASHDTEAVFVVVQYGDVACI